MAYEPPKSTEAELYINKGNFGTISLSELLEEAIDHFGPCKFEDLTISAEWIKTDGCSCCFDYSDYENFICITINRKG